MVEVRFLLPAYAMDAVGKHEMVRVYLNRVYHGVTWAKATGRGGHHPEESHVEYRVAVEVNELGGLLRWVNSMRSPEYFAQQEIYVVLSGGAGLLY